MPGRYSFEIVVYLHVLERIDGTERSQPKRGDTQYSQPEQF